ncbi:MAG: thymidine kinase, partial [Actinopolymorphaceae bacterium]
MAELVFFTGTMDCGKSTLALQLDYNARQRGLAGRLFTCHDRAGQATLSSRLGLTVPAIEVKADLNLQRLVVGEMTAGARIDYLICDEAQFYSGEQIEQLGRIVDELSVDVYAFGILTDFRTRLFEGSQRLVELADRVEALQVRSLCWCGRTGTHNARTVGGVMVTEGEQVVIGD